jgi:hypothetical protein
LAVALGFVILPVLLAMAAPVSAQCNVQTPIAPNATVSGTLAPGDCTIAQLAGGGSDTSFVDLYQVTLPVAGTLTISLQSANFDAFLFLRRANLASIASDNNSGGGSNALITRPLNAGTYIILANSFFNGETGAYTLTTAFVASSPLVAAILPTSRSVQVGATATVFATLINSSSVPATGCGVAPITPIPAGFHFQTTSSATNQVTGGLDVPVDIPAGAAQSFLLSATPTSTLAPTDVQLSFDCTNTEPAPVNVGLNTLLLSGSTSAVADIVALAVTPTGDGIVNIAGSTGTGVFSVASVNVGAAASVIVSADLGGASLPLTLTLCETNPATGACTSVLASSVATVIAAGATPTFAVFATASGDVPFNPTANRIFVRFRDGGNAVRGATSVAVRTQ